MDLSPFASKPFNLQIKNILYFMLRKACESNPTLVFELTPSKCNPKSYMCKEKPTHVGVFSKEKA
jgi:hypothetical protein